MLCLRLHKILKDYFWVQVNIKEGFYPSSILMLMTMSLEPILNLEIYQKATAQFLVLHLEMNLLNFYMIEQDYSQVSAKKIQTTVDLLSLFLHALLWIIKIQFSDKSQLNQFKNLKNLRD